MGQSRTMRARSVRPHVLGSLITANAEQILCAPFPEDARLAMRRSGRCGRPRAGQATSRPPRRTSCGPWTPSCGFPKATPWMPLLSSWGGLTRSPSPGPPVQVSCQQSALGSAAVAIRAVGGSTEPLRPNAIGRGRLGLHRPCSSLMREVQNYRQLSSSDGLAARSDASGALHLRIGTWRPLLPRRGAHARQCVSFSRWPHWTTCFATSPGCSDTPSAHWIATGWTCPTSVSSPGPKHGQRLPAVGDSERPHTMHPARRGPR